MNALVTILSVFLGAYLAFKYETRRKEADERSARVSVVNQALFTLYNQWNILGQYEREVCVKHRKSPISWLNMPATSPIEVGLVGFNWEGLAFLLESSDPTIYSNLMLEERRFRFIVGQIHERSELLSQTVLPKLADAGVKSGDSIDVPAVEAFFGPHVVALLKASTNAVINGTESSLVSTEEAFHRLRSVAHTMYPKATLVKVVFVAAKS